MHPIDVVVNSYSAAGNARNSVWLYDLQAALEAEYQRVYQMSYPLAALTEVTGKLRRKGVHIFNSID